MIKITKKHICYQDSDLVVVNKPPGIVVNKAKTVTGPTLQDWFEETFLSCDRVEEPSLDWQELVPENFNDEYGTPLQIFAERQGMVHRLDKDTSGVIIFARNPGSLVNLLYQFKNREVSKQYLCLVHGKFKIPTGHITAPMSRQEKKFTINISGKEAKTQYRVVKYFPEFNEQRLEKLLSSNQKDPKILKAMIKKTSMYQGFSLVECKPLTGRTHQIRVHLKFAGHPLVGDTMYVGKKRAKLDREWCPRQFLHAQKITFTHPRTKEKMTVEADLPQDLVEVKKLLKDENSN